MEAVVLMIIGVMIMMVVFGYIITREKIEDHLQKE